jgi:hypothetical protein
MMIHNRSKLAFLTSAMVLIGVLWVITYDVHAKLASMVPPNVTAITVLSIGSSNQLVVENEFHGEIKCNRLIAHYATSDDDSKDQTTIVIDHGIIVPVAFTANAADLYPPPVRYKLLLTLPSGMQPGHWWYRNRVVYLCSIWPGFVIMRAYEIVKMPFDLPPQINHTP